MQYQDAPVHPGPKAVVVPALAVTTAAVAWRRTYPIEVLALSGGLISAMALAFGAGDGGPSLFVLLLVVVYSAAAHADRPILTAAIAAAVVGIHDLRDEQIGGVGDAVFVPALAAIAFAFGRAVHARHDQAALRADAAVTESGRGSRASCTTSSPTTSSVMVVQAGRRRSCSPTTRPGEPRGARGDRGRSGQDALGEMRRLLGLLRDDDDAGGAGARSRRSPSSTASSAEVRARRPGGRARGRAARPAPLPGGRRPSPPTGSSRRR